MSERDSLTDGIERRGVLAAVATGLGGVGLARSSLARQIDAMDASQFVVEQNGRCVPITPLSGDETVERFYDYRTPNTSPPGSAYSSYGTTDLQRPETSICFLYDGPEGLSLVVVHDELEDGTNGGAVTFRFDGLAGGSWVVGDDDYDGSTNYDTWTETSDGWRVDWTWASGRSDGGAFRPLGDEFAVIIDPGFNEDAALYGEYYEGEITDWQVLSGDRGDPERISLALDQPLTIRVGGCGGSQTTTTTSRGTTTGEETTTESETTTEEETTEEETTEEESTDDRQSSGPISVEVEVEPGKVNPRSHGRLPVVVHSTGEFDATTLESRSVEFGPGNASPVKRIRTDVNGDGRRDLKLHFWMDEIDLDWDTDELELTGQTSNGREVVGVANIELVPAGGDDEDEKADGDGDQKADGDEDDEEREAKRDEAEDGDEQAEKDDDDEEEKDGEKEEYESEEGGDDDEEGDEDDDDEEDEDDEDDDNDDEDEDDEEEDEENEGWWNDEGDDSDEREDDEDDERGRGRGNGRGRGRGNGGDRGKSRGNGRGHGRDEDD